MPHRIGNFVSGAIKDTCGTTLPQRKSDGCQEVHPSEMPLLCEASDLNADARFSVILAAPGRRDDLGTAQGVIVAVAVCVPFWIILIFGIHYVIP